MVPVIRPVQVPLGFSAPYYVVNKGEDSTKFSLTLTRARERMVVRLTGGCGYMSPESADGLYEMFLTAFRGFEGALLFGGTRMLARDDLNRVIPSITEIPPLIKEANPGCEILGVIPKTADLAAVAGIGNVVSDEEKYYTIAHPYQTSYVLVQDGPDKLVPWETEFEVCRDITSRLRDYAGFGSLLLSFDGGGTTEKEILDLSARGWPVLLIDGSGRKTQEYARNREWLMAHPNVSVCDNDAASLRAALVELGVVTQKMGELRALPRLEGARG